MLTSCSLDGRCLLDYASSLLVFFADAREEWAKTLRSPTMLCALLIDLIVRESGLSLPCDDCETRFLGSLNMPIFDIGS